VVDFEEHGAKKPKGVRGGENTQPLIDH